MDKVLSKMQLRAYHILEMKFLLTGNIDSERSFSYSNQFGISLDSTKDKGYTVSMRYEINEDPKDFPFELCVDLIGFFDFDPTVIDEDEKKTLLTYNGTAILLPYLRAIVTQITALAGVSPLLLPIFDVNELIPDDDI